MKLFIIGNGFDIGYKISTSYWDFRKFSERCYPNFSHAFKDIGTGKKGQGLRKLNLGFFQV